MKPSRCHVIAVALITAFVAFLWIGSSSLPQTTSPAEAPLTSAVCDTSAAVENFQSQLAFQAAQIVSLRDRLFEETCSPTKLITSTGSWCLQPRVTPLLYRGSVVDYALSAHHQPADAGVGLAVLRTVHPTQSLLDIGAGVGQYGHFLRMAKSPIRWSGFDGAINVESFTGGFVKWSDVTIPGFVPPGGSFDWVLCLEMGEHVSAKYASVIFDTLHRNNKCGVILSWAVPGQGGHGHVNEQPNEYVAERMTALGYTLDHSLTAFGRAKACYPWFRNTFMVFRRDSAPATCRSERELLCPNHTVCPVPWGVDCKDPTQ